MTAFNDWVEQQRLKGFLEHTLTLGDIESAWNDATARERSRCTRIVDKISHADVVYPEGVRMVLTAISNPID